MARRTLRVAFRSLVGAFAVFCVATLITALRELVTWPDVARLATHNPSSTAFIERYETRQREAGRDAEIGLAWTPYDRISPHLKRAVLVAEDINFFTHDGFDREEIDNALHDALAGRRTRGASTISQQLAKNLWLSPSRNPYRKLKEALLTRSLEEHLEKKRILELYLNVVELGPGIWGVGNAARVYYGKTPSELTEIESALLAASLPRPRTWNPSSSSPSYRRHVHRILERMRKAQWLYRVI